MQTCKNKDKTGINWKCSSCVYANKTNIKLLSWVVGGCKNYEPKMLKDKI